MLFEKKVVSKLAIRSLARVVFQKWTDDTFEISYRRQHGYLNLWILVSATPNPRALGKLTQYNLKWPVYNYEKKENEIAS